MKLFDWVLLIISILWLVVDLIQLFSLLDSYEVRYQGAKVKIGWAFFVPMVMWLIIAYRIGG